jgi:sec-independent protein translocase protein TatB
MANFGLTEMLLIGILVIVFVGPDDLPKMLKTLGRAYGKIRRASYELRRAFTLEVDKVEADSRADEIRRRRQELLERRRANMDKAKEDGAGVAHSDASPDDAPAESPSEAPAAPAEAPVAAPTPDEAPVASSDDTGSAEDSP